MKKIIVTILILSLLLSSLSAQSISEKTEEKTTTILFTDDCGRTVELPQAVTKVAPSGAVATMILTSLAPEYLCNVNATPSKEELVYLPQEVAALPATGNLYGGKSTLNTEEILALGAEIIIDIGDYKKGIENDLDTIQNQIGIPCIFLKGDLEHMADTFRRLGTLLAGKEERAEQLALFIEKTVGMAAENRKKVQEGEVLSVMYTSGKDGLGTNAYGSSQAQVIELVGGKNAILVDNVTSKGGGNKINMEQLFLFNPDVILFTTGSIYKDVAADSSWALLDAVKNGKFYEIPCTPYNWMSNPPSMNMVLGVWWLGNLLYPQYFDYAMTEVAKEFYHLFWNYDLTDTEVHSLLSASTERK